MKGFEAGEALIERVDDSVLQAKLKVRENSRIAGGSIARKSVVKRTSVEVSALEEDEMGNTQRRPDFSLRFCCQVLCINPCINYSQRNEDSMLIIVLNKNLSNQFLT